MTTAHQVAGVAAILSVIPLLAVAGWSWLAAHRSGGRRDHRFAVDRALLLVVALVALALIAGLLVAAGGDRPADPLHFLYGLVALLALPGGRALGGRLSVPGPAGRSRRAAWNAVAAAVLLGVGLRLLQTG